MVTCRQQEHPMAGPFLEMATRPLSETMEVSHITNVGFKEIKRFCTREL